MYPGMLVWYLAGQTVMSATEVTMVRIYLHESNADIKELLSYLHDQSKVSGVTVFRGVTGFGVSGKYHSSSLLDLSLDLPLVIEFFDHPEKINNILEHLKTTIKPGHIVCWPASIYS